MAEPFPPLVGVLNEPVDSAARIAADADDDRPREEVVDMLRRVADESGRIDADLVGQWHARLDDRASGVRKTLDGNHDRFSSIQEGLSGEAATVDILQHHLNDLEARLSSLEADHADVEADLDRVAATYDQTPGGYGAIARLADMEDELDDHEARARRLVAGLKQFEDWVEDPAARYAHLDDDLDFVANYMEEIESALDHLESDGSDPVGQWVRASLLLRACRFLRQDVAADLAALREWDEHDRADHVADRLDRQAARLDRFAERIPPQEPDTLADGVHEILEDLDDTLEGFERPVDWDDVHDALRTARSDLESLNEPVGGSPVDEA